MAERRILPSALAVALIVGLAAGCGSSSSSSGSTSTTSAEAGNKAAATRRAAESRAPKGASPALRAIYATFPPPKPSPEVKGSAAATRAGALACKGKTPTQVKEEFYAAARHKFPPEQTKMIDRIPSLESHDPMDPSFTAGQLAADVYEATLSEASGQYGYQGCIYSLARALERRLAPSR